MADATAALTGLFGIQWRNLQALVEAQHAAAEGFAALGRQQAELLSAALMALPTAPTGDVAAGIAQPIEALKAALLESAARNNALAETVGRANAEVAGILQDRTLAALEEWKASLLLVSGG